MYSDYNFIPIGDHCIVSSMLSELKLRKQSYPFDWVTNVEQVYDTNIIYNLQIINELTSSDNVDDIVKKYMGDAFDNEKTNNINTIINSVNNIWFPHDTGNITDIFDKYKRRFIRLKSDLNKKNMFVFITRHYYIEEDIFKKIMEQLLNYNNNSIILFISGTDHTYFENINYSSVIFKYIEYDISKFYNYDYTTFRPNVFKFLSELKFKF